MTWLRILHISTPRQAAVMGLLLMHAALLAWSGYRHSPAGDEIAHLPAGISHWSFGRFDLYRVNPPLVRMVAAIPILLVNPDIDWSSYSEAPEARMEFDIGRRFVKQHGLQSLSWYTLARWSCIPFSLLGGYICYRWAKDLYGMASGLLALVLWCFSPNILAYGQLITPDMGAASVGAAACYFFWRWSRSFAWFDSLSAGLLLGLAELTKTTWIILFLIWPLLWLSRGYCAHHGRPLLKGVLHVSAMLLLSIYVLNAGYGFEGTWRRLGDYQFLSSALSGREQHKEFMGNRFRGTLLASVPVPLPTNYVQGIDVTKTYFERGVPSYLRGEWKHGGWWYYYIYALAIKVPLGTWGLAVCALMVEWRGRRCGLQIDQLMLLLPAIGIFTLVSLQTGINHHLRYVLPAFPFAIIYISGCLQGFSWTHHWKLGVLVSMLLGWMIASSLCVYPHSLSYFNELAGGPRNGHAHLLESNIDWGQDLIYLKEWVEEHPEASPIGMACFTQIDPESIGIKYWLPLNHAKRRETVRSHIGKLHSSSDDLRLGWYAISANYLRGMTRFPLPDGSGRRVWPDGTDYTRFLRLQPNAQIGYSIYLYRVGPSELAQLRQE
jgi:4-amino-4-deoxy-L-arabinose transferase-like glycosyltransferase